MADETKLIATWDGKTVRWVETPLPPGFDPRVRLSWKHPRQVFPPPGGGWFMVTVGDPTDFTYPAVPAAEDDCDPPTVVEGSR